MSEPEPKTTPPLVSVIIPTYNGAHCVSEAIESALSQSFTDFEVIVVDDGSTDGTVDVLSQYGAKIKIVRKSNGGIASARNAGIEALAGEWIALLDHDDLWDRDKLERQVSHLRAHPDLALLYSRARVIRDSRETGGRQELTGSPLPAGFPQYEGLLMKNIVPPLTAIFRRDVVSSLGGLRQQLAPADDWDLWLRIAKQHRIGFIPDVLATYRLHGDNYHLKNMQRMIEMGDKIFFSRLPEITDRRVSREARIQHYCWAAPAWGYTGSVGNMMLVLFRLWLLGGLRHDVGVATLRALRECLNSMLRRVRRHIWWTQAEGRFGNLV